MAKMNSASILKWQFVCQELGATIPYAAGWDLKALRLLSKPSFSAQRRHDILTACNWHSYYKGMIG